MTTLDYALAYIHAGLSVIPIRPDGSKAPAIPSWEAYQHRRPNEHEVRAWFAVNLGYGIAIICGSVSRNLEVVDFDSREAWEDFRHLAESQSPGFLKTVPTVVTPRGVHLYLFRSVKVLGNRKLAKAPTGKAAIETRGEGGYVLAPGSPAGCHPDKKIYSWSVLPEGICLA